MAVVRQIWSCALLLVAAGPAGCSNAIANRATGVGMSGSQVRNESLARATAQNQAIATLQKMLRIDAVRFRYRRTHDGTDLELAVAPGRVRNAKVSFQRLQHGWMAMASGARTPQVLTYLGKARPVTATAAVHKGDLRRALSEAERQAARQIIAAVSACRSSCDVRGFLTYLRYEVTPLAHGLNLTLSAHVRVTDKKTR